MVERFEEAVCASQAVIARELRELDRLSASDQELITTYYGLLAGGVRLPDDDDWDFWRRIADETLFPGYKENIRFAALSLNGCGVEGFGGCSLVLCEGMFAHRASVFEENSTLFVKKHGHRLPPGFRATWKDRAKLCVAKLADQIGSSTGPEQFPSLLLRQGATREESRFVEVHIWGPMTMHTVEKVIISSPYLQAFLEHIRDRSRGLRVEVEEAI